ncbi:universal stress protein [Halovivax sp.]|uniref:universal stress protein n=1 Tax=Halovivax sp. TaxID=1935978 RepID=UPI0025C3A674|nr:universal stress protein [Halovivax sp.]
MDRHVLVPLDGSKPSWEALDHAAANADGDRITVLHVVDPAEGVYAGAEGGYYDAEAFDRAVDRGEDLCERARERLREAGALDRIELETAVETGKAARTIVDYAADHGVDHVVIGSHGRKGVSRILLGSVAETVIRRAPCPVTVVR